MAKLADLQKWLEFTLEGDSPRANSLVKTIRQAGLFTTSGKGRHAPQMESHDFATAICAALVSDAPTVAPVTIAQLLNARFSDNIVTRADGSEDVSYNSSITAFDTDEYGNRILPDCFPVTPQNLSQALQSLASWYALCGDEGVSFYDRIELTTGGGWHWIDVFLHGPEFGPEESRDDRLWKQNKKHTEYEWQMRFAAERPGKVRSGRIVTISLESEALNSLARIAHRDAPQNADEAAENG